MERQVARAQGERSQDEQTNLEEQIKKATEQLKSNQENIKLLSQSNKKL